MSELEVMNELLIEQIRRATSMAPRLILGLIVLAGFLAAGITLRNWLRRLGKGADESRRHAMRVLGRSSLVALALVGIVSALGTIGVNVIAIVTLLGLIGLASILAFRDVLSNLVAGVLLLVHRPFQYEDRIEVVGVEGAVIEMRLGYITLRTEKDEVLVPNMLLYTNTVRVVQHRTED